MNNILHSLGWGVGTHMLVLAYFSLYVRKMTAGSEADRKRVREYALEAALTAFLLTL